MPPRKRSADIYIAKNAFWVEIDGESQFISKDQRIRAGHPVIRSNPDNFEPISVDDGWDMPDIEQATAAPGELR